MERIAVLVDRLDAIVIFQKSKDCESKFICYMNIDDLDFEGEGLTLDSAFEDAIDKAKQKFGTSVEVLSSIK